MESFVAKENLDVSDIFRNFALDFGTQFVRFC